MTATAPDLRWLLQLVLLSLVLALLVTLAFRRNAPSKLALGGLAAGCLLLAPGLLLFTPTWHLPLSLSQAELWQARWRMPLPLLLLLLWALVAVLLSLHIWLQTRRAQDLLRKASPWSAPHLLPLLREQASALGMPQAPTLVLMPETGPCCSVWGPPLIALPLVAKDWPSTRLQAVLAHEMVHLARHDGWRLLWLRLLVAWYWCLPWVWLLRQQCSQALEATCDDRAARLLGDPLAYTSAITEVARQLRRQSQVQDSQGRLVPDQQPALDQAGLSLPRLAAGSLRWRIQRFLDTRIQQLHVPALYWTLVGVLSLGLITSALEFRTPTPVLPQYSSANSLPTNAATTATAPGPNIQVQLLGSSLRGYPQQVSAAHNQLLQALPRPVYPGQAIRAGQEADVQVLFSVRPYEQRLHARILGNDDTGFGEAVLRALQQRQQLGGARVPTLTPGEYRVLYRFRLHPNTEGGLP